MTVSPPADARCDCGSIELEVLTSFSYALTVPSSTTVTLSCLACRRVFAKEIKAACNP